MFWERPQTSLHHLGETGLHIEIGVYILRILREGSMSLFVLGFVRLFLEHKALASSAFLASDAKRAF